MVGVQPLRHRVDVGLRAWAEGTPGFTRANAMSMRAGGSRWRRRATRNGQAAAGM